jgi:hypothetical protein
MNLFVIRQTYTPISTLGELIFNHKVFCYTLEDTVRLSTMPKVQGETAIPAGRYKLAVDESARFQRNTPHVLDVLNFDGIRLHGGNTAADTEGCILVAYNKINDQTIQGSAEFALTELLQSESGPHFIEIIDTFPYVGIGV